AIAGEQSVRSGESLQLAEQFLLNIEAFGNAFDHDIDVGPMYVLKRCRSMQTVQPFACPQLLQAMAYPLGQAGASICVGLDDGGVAAGTAQNDGNVGAHGSTADNNRSRAAGAEEMGGRSERDRGVHGVT